MRNPKDGFKSISKDARFSRLFYFFLQANVKFLCTKWLSLHLKIRYERLANSEQ